MRHLFILFFMLSVLVDLSAQSNFPTQLSSGSSQTLSTDRGGRRALKGFVNATYTDTTAANLDTNYIKFNPGAQIFTTSDNKFWLRNTAASQWLLAGGGGTGGIVPGGPITTIPVVGTNPGTNLASEDWIIATFYGTQPPTATLTGGGTYELTSDATLDATLNWGASRQAATATLATIVVASVSQSFSQPSAPGTVSGTQAVTVTTNTSTTYSNVVTTTDSRTATATTTFTYRAKYYRGFVPNNNPSDAEILAATGGTVGGTFATTYLAAGDLSEPLSTSYIVFAFPASFGTATIKINGLAVSYTLITRSLTNASGYSQLYNIYVSPFPTGGAVEYQVL